MAQAMRCYSAEGSFMSEEIQETGIVDWEAKFEELNEKYNELKEHSRKWEKMAKASKDAADELEKIKAERLTDQEKLEKRAEDAEKQLNELLAEKARAERVKNVAKDTGLSIEILEVIDAQDEDSLRERANQIKETFAPKETDPQTVPVILGDGKHAEPPEPTTDFFREIFTK